MLFSSLVGLISEQWQMSSRQLVGVIGSGMIGTDPFSEAAWSGSSRFFFEECRRQGLLRRAFGVEAGRPQKAWLALKNFSPQKAVWKQNLYLETSYYDLLTRRILSELDVQDLASIILQIGGIYNIKKHVGDECPVVSYHDGNLAQAIKSPWYRQDVSRARIRRALDY